MAKQINQYTKVRTEGTVQLADLMDFDSTDDVGVTYESARITVKEFRDYLRNSIPTLYSQDGSLGANRTVDLDTNTLGFIDGNVGIGTAAPTEKLEVVGNGIIRSEGLDTGNLKVQSEENVANLWLDAFTSSQGTSGGGNVYFTALGSTKARIQTDTSNNRLTIESLNNYDINIFRTGTGGIFLGNGFTQLQSPIVTVINDLGIGTATPTAKLNVKGSGATSATTSLLVENSVGTDLLTVKDDGEVSSANGYWIDGSLFAHQTGGTSNSFVGGQVALSCSVNGNNSGFGFQSLRLLTTGSDSSSFGNYSLSKVTNGVWNTAMGSRILQNLNGVNQSGNTGTGSSCLNLLTSGNHNTGNGYSSLDNLLTGEGNVAVGKLSGDVLANGSFNTFLGTETKTDGDYSYSIALGYRAEVTASNQFVLGDSFGVINDAYFGRGVSAQVAQLLPFNMHTTSVDAGITDGSAAASDFVINGARGTGTGSGGDIVFKTAPSGTTGSTQNALVTTMTLKDSGNVGIGTTTPSELLEVDGNGLFNGNLGVGVTTPLAPLDVNGNIYQRSGTLFIDSVITTYNSNDIKIQAPSAKNIIFTSGSERMRINLNGDVGIGTDVPTAKLNVETSTSAGANNAFLVSNNINDLFTIKDDGNVFMGNNTLSTVASPININMGGEISSVNGGNLKFTILDIGTAQAGIGAWTGGMYHKTWSAGAKHSWYQGANKVMELESENLYIGVSTIANAKLNMRLNSDAAGNNGILAFNATGSQVFNVRDNGNMGIGGTATTTSSLNISNLPTSLTGLVAGDVWNNAGVLTIV